MVRGLVPDPRALGYRFALKVLQAGFGAYRRTLQTRP